MAGLMLSRTLHLRLPHPLPPRRNRSLRGTFIIDPKGILKHYSVNDLDVGRNIDELLRLLHAFQTGELCPASWKKGEKTLK